ncbi:MULTISPECIES: HD domain-containing protein [Nitrosopumilus]|uniref:5'-deoxynucleotidase n=1 Tax=Nitrosopumilus piranensis TaxID=1582439 RepID=A0A0C5BWF6_9ARCH|nr:MULTISPECIES: HD domain-containing protein [Nitrosopumilus]AJM92549.1 Metal dependent phosphohydrolase [Nitrosopumilus piranensis]KAF6244434.1 phosphohydrolase [Nitrosopumilus sp. b2]
MIEDFLKIAVNLKNVPRQGWIDKLSINNPESVADHTFSMSIIGMIISDLENLNSEKILKMILLHDLAESKIGDIVPEKINEKEKEKLENSAFDEIIQTLPDATSSQYFDMWREYQENSTAESQIVHQIDKLEMALQAKMYQSQGLSKEKLDTFFESAKKSITHPRLKELFTKIVESN